LIHERKFIKVDFQNFWLNCVTWVVEWCMLINYNICNAAGCHACYNGQFWNWVCLQCWLHLFSSFIDPLQRKVRTLSLHAVSFVSGARKSTIVQSNLIANNFLYLRFFKSVSSWFVTEPQPTRQKTIKYKVPLWHVSYLYKMYDYICNKKEWMAPFIS
jgi:hypothetical protein